MKINLYEWILNNQISLENLNFKNNKIIKGWKNRNSKVKALTKMSLFSAKRIITWTKFD